MPQNSPFGAPVRLGQSYHLSNILNSFELHHLYSRVGGLEHPLHAGSYRFHRSSCPSYQSEEDGITKGVMGSLDLPSPLGVTIGTQSPAPKCKNANGQTSQSEIDISWISGHTVGNAPKDGIRWPQWGLTVHPWNPIGQRTQLMQLDQAHRTKEREGIWRCNDA